MKTHNTTTLRKIAQMTEKSVNTVSRALNNKDGVSTETKDLINRVAMELNYRPNLMARGMRRKQSELIGVLVQDISNPFFIQMLEGAEVEADKAGMNLLICSSRGSIEKEQKHINTFLSYNCSGMALNLVSPKADLIEKLKNEHRNIVILDAPLKEDLNCARICVDNEHDSLTVVEYLLRLGHRRVAIINPELRTATMNERYTGYRRALEKYDLPEDPLLMRTCNDKDDAHQAALELATQRNGPTAIFIAKQSLGLSVVSALMSAGVRIPEDISIAIFGEPDWAMVFKPRITCMQRQVSEIGRMGIRILLSEIRGEKTEDNGRVVLSSQLMIRESVKIIS